MVQQILCPKIFELKKKRPVYIYKSTNFIFLKREKNKRWVDFYGFFPIIFVLKVMLKWIVWSFWFLPIYGKLAIELTLNGV